MSVSKTSPTKPLRVQIVDADCLGRTAHHDPDVMAGLDELAGDVRAEEPVGADDEFRTHWAPPWRIHSAAWSSRVPSACAPATPLEAGLEEAQGL